MLRNTKGEKWADLSFVTLHINIFRFSEHIYGQNEMGKSKVIFRVA